MITGGPDTPPAPSLRGREGKKMARDVAGAEGLCNVFEDRSEISQTTLDSQLWGRSSCPQPFPPRTLIATITTEE